MKTLLNRRTFLQAGSSALALAGLAPATLAEDKKITPPRKRKLKKGIVLNCVGLKGTTLEKCQAIKAAGFDGIEVLGDLNPDEVLKACEATGLSVGNVCCASHWKMPLSSPDPAVRAACVEDAKTALRNAQRYGAPTVLLVPALVNEQVSYADAWVRSAAEIRKILPVAEELGVSLCLENVWNNFLLSPLEAARFVDELGSKAAGWTFDAGNILRYGWPEHWIPVLGKRLRVFHLKEYDLDLMASAGVPKGFKVEYLEGSNDWAAIMKAMDAIGYTGWGIAEPAYAKPADDAAGLQKISDALENIFAL